MALIDKLLLNAAKWRSNSLNLQKKAGGMSGGMPYAYIQDMIPYSIGDSPKNYLTHGYNQNALVYAVIGLITSAASKATFKMMDVSNPDKKEEIKTHPFLDLLRMPAPMYDRREFIANTIGFKELTGEAFIYKNRFTTGKNRGLAGQLIIMPPQYIRVEQDKATGLAKKYVYYDGTVKQEIAPEDMIFMRYWNPEGSIRGFSPLKAGREVVSQSNDMYKTNRKLTANGGPPGILSLDDSTGIEFDDTARDKLLEKYRETYGTPDNAGTPIITNGKWSWTSTGLKAEDLMLKEGQRMALRDICNLYGISSQLLNDPENKTYNNMQDARKALILNCVMPKLHLWIDAIHRDLLSEWEKVDNKKYEIVIEKNCWEEIRNEELQLVQQLNTAWWLTINQKLKLMGQEPLTIDQGDDIYVPLNYMPISTTSDAAAQLRNAHAQASQGIAPKPDVPEAEPPQPIPTE